MPYSGAGDPNLPDHVKKMPDHMRKQWVEVFNSAMKSCMAKGKGMKDCEGSAFAQANGVVAKRQHGLFSRMWEGLKGIKETLDNLFAEMPQERAISLPDVYEQVVAQLERYMGAGKFEYPWLVDVYANQGEMFAVIADAGKLYRANVLIGEQGIVMDEPMVISESLPTPNTPSTMRVVRQSDGRMRWFLISATAYLNRNAEIDSTQLFDNLNKRSYDTGNFPYLSYYHLGENFRLGQADYLARDGYVHVSSGLFDTSEMSDKMLRLVEEQPAGWGASISYWPLGAPTMEEVVDGVKIPVYTDGEFEEISLLRERDACSLYTSLMVEANTMNERIKQALVELAGGDESLLSEFETLVDRANKAKEDQQLIARGNTEGCTDCQETPAAEQPTETPAAEEQPVETPAETPAEEPVTETPAAETPAEEPVAREIEVDDSLVNEIAARVIAHEKVAELSNRLDQASQKVLELVADVQKLSSENEALKARLAQVEKPVEEQHQVWNDDRPRQRQTLVYRRSQSEEAAPEINPQGKAPLADIANETLSRIK